MHSPYRQPLKFIGRDGFLDVICYESARWQLHSAVVWFEQPFSECPNSHTPPSQHSSMWSTSADLPQQLFQHPAAIHPPRVSSPVELH